MLQAANDYGSLAEPAVMRRWGELLLPTPVPPAEEWIGDNLVLNPDVEASGGRINLDERPYWRFVFRAFDDPEVDQITILKSTQVGGTVALWCHLLFKAVHDPAPTMVVLPDKESAIEFRDRVYMNAMECAETAAMVPEQRAWNTRYIDLGTMRCYLAWSGSAQKLRMKACQEVLLSEVDVFGTTAGHRGGNPNKAAAERTKSFYRRKIYRESSPTAEPSTIAGEYEHSNQGRLWCPCPICNHFQVLRFFPFRGGNKHGCGGIVGYEDEHGNRVEADQAEADARYICEQGCEISPDQIADMVKQCVYAPKGQKVVDGKLTGKPAMSVRNWGMHLWSIHAPTISIGRIAREYIEQSRAGNLSDFNTNWRGLEHTQSRKMPTWEQLGRNLQADYDRGFVHPDSWFLTASADVQMDRVKWMVIAWGHMSSAWLVDWGELWRDSDREIGLIVPDDLNQFHETVATRTWPVANDGVNQQGYSDVPVRMAVIDSNHRTLDVHNYVRSANQPSHVRAIRGDHQLHGGLFRHNVIEKNTRTGEIYDGGLEQWGFNVHSLKMKMLDAFQLRSGDLGGFHFPRGMLSQGKSVLQELVNEPATREQQKDGRYKIVFVPKSGTIPVDYWDTAVYGRGAAEMIVQLNKQAGWDSARWPRLGPKPPPIPTRNVAPPSRG